MVKLNLLSSAASRASKSVPKLQRDCSSAEICSLDETESVLMNLLGYPEPLGFGETRCESAPPISLSKCSPFPKYMPTLDLGLVLVLFCEPVSLCPGLVTYMRATASSCISPTKIVLPTNETTTSSLHPHGISDMVLVGYCDCHNYLCTTGRSNLVTSNDFKRRARHSWNTVLRRMQSRTSSRLGSKGFTSSEHSTWTCHDPCIPASTPL